VAAIAERLAAAFSELQQDPYSEPMNCPGLSKLQRFGFLIDQKVLL